MAVGTAGVQNSLQYGPGMGSQAPGNPALDGLRRLGALNSAGSGSTGPINPHRLTEQDNWSYPPSATPPAELSGPQTILDSLRMAYGVPRTTAKLGFGQGAVPFQTEKPNPIVLSG
jgi:hypothetical protein